jgi:hypothetical protein
LPDNERDSLINTEAWLVATSAKLGPSAIDVRREAAYDFQLARLMVTIGRTDIGLNHMLRRFETVYSQAEEIRRELEPKYLHEIGAFARDLCYDISFAMSPQGGWRPRSVSGYPVQLDFLHNLGPDGKLVEPGEVVVLNNGLPYGMVNPEEDCATSFAVYGAVGKFCTTSPLYDPLINQHQQSVTARGIARWAIAARERRNPAPSLAPYLKVIWLEWFSQAFEPLRCPQTESQTFIYRPLAATGLTSPEQVAALRNDPASTNQQRALINRFLTLRSFLERYYNLQ